MVCYHWCSLSKSYILLMLFLCIQYAELQTPDPCDTTEALNDMNKRHPTYQMDATPLCDYDLVKKWYSVGSKVMPTTAPDLLSCGTLYPYWIKDPLPTVTNTIAEVTACKVEFGDTCAKDHKIRVKKCNDFLVFELIPTTGCSSAYCFERADGCIPQTVTDVSVSYQNVMWDSSLPNNRGIVRHSPYFNLICNFAPLPTPNLNYKITWYIDKKEIQTQVVTSSTRNKATFSAKEMANHIETLNVWVHCTVEVMGSTTGTSCPSKESPLFFVGVKILSELPIVMNRGGRAFIKLQPTVPFVTDTLMLGNIVLDATPVELDLFAKTTQCNGALVNGFSCSKKIKGFPYPDRVQYDTPTNWNQVINYEIVNENTAAFDIPHLITLQLTSTSGSGVVGHMFGKLPFPDLPIQMVEDKNSWKGKSCTALTDPHMRTFDNLGYECQLDGKFILYRNTESNQEVHVKHRLCHRWYSVPRCICAVAVRAGRQIFTIDICQGNRYINFPLCEDEVMKVVREQDKLYKIYLPSGTTVQISIREWPWGTGTLHLDVTIYPSAADEGKSEGLCGSLDNSYHNDLTRRNHAQPDPIVTYPDGFSRSWVVEANEDLFDKDINEYGFINSMSITNRLLCECNPTSKTALCTYTAGKTCYYERGRKLQCFIFGENKFDKRRKRSIYELDKTEQKKKQHKVSRRESGFPVSRAQAETICSEAFNKSSAYQTCLQSVPSFSNDSLENCILDLMMTGDDNITKIHIEAALEHCTTFIVLNTTFTTIEPDVAYILTSRCPGNCSENGQCNAGICTCHEGFAGSDCSFDSSEPPQITGTSYDFCDQRSHECNALYFQGSYFLENMGAVCYTERNERNMDNSLRSSDFYMASLEEQTLFLGSCELRNSSGGYWVTDFTINITIDGIRFTSDYKVTIYSSVCQQYHNDSGHVYFTLKNGYCFINSTSSCVADGDSKEFDYCSVCNTSVNSFDWTENTECLFLASNSTQNSTPIASITTSDISMTPLTTTTSEAPAAPTTTRTSLSTIPTSLANLSTDTKQFETTIPTADLTTTTSTKILEKTTASQTTAQAKSATITSPVTKSTTPTTSITSPMTISIISTSLQPPTTIPTITSPTAGSESLISSSKSSSTTKMHQTTSTTSPESSVEPKPQSTEASTEKILTTQSQWTPESSDSPSSLFLSTPQTSNDSDQKQAIIIASCLVCGMIVLIVSGVVLKKYCIRQGNIDDPYIQENNIQYPDRSDNTKKSSISIDFITKNTKLPEDILPSRPTSASSYYSTGVQQLSSTTDLRDVFNGNGMKDRSLLFRASSPK